MKDLGILTNPYFRKGIVKIGRSERPVNTRAKELYNTSVPDRFEEFASISTVKFKEVEKHVYRVFMFTMGSIRDNAKPMHYDSGTYEIRR